MAFLATSLIVLWSLSSLHLSQMRIGVDVQFCSLLLKIIASANDNGCGCGVVGGPRRAYFCCSASAELMLAMARVLSAITAQIRWQSLVAILLRPESSRTQAIMVAWALAGSSLVGVLRLSPASRRGTFIRPWWCPAPICLRRCLHFGCRAASS